MEEICILTGFRASDVLYTLHLLDLLSYYTEDDTDHLCVDRKRVFKGGVVVPENVVESIVMDQIGGPQKFKRLVDPDAFKIDLNVLEFC